MQIPKTSQELFTTLVDSALDYWKSDAGESSGTYIRLFQAEGITDMTDIIPISTYAALFNHGQLIVNSAIETLNDYKAEITEKIVLNSAKLIGQ